MKFAAVCIAFAIFATLPAAGIGTAYAEDMGHPTSRSDVEDRCNELQRQYEAVASEHKADAQAEIAGKLHEAGVSACQNNEIETGIQYLTQALREIGIQPAD
jgi:hypothetical protein